MENAVMMTNTAALASQPGLVPGSDTLTHEPTIKYKNPAVTTDGVVMRRCRTGDGSGMIQLEVLMIKRGRNPYYGYWACPGGYVEYGEDPEDAVLRELKEECNCSGKLMGLVCVRGSPMRAKPRHVITICYAVDGSKIERVQGGDDASEAKWLAVSEVLNGKYLLAFDHLELVREGARMYGDRVGVESQSA
jgi:8-oxo-dGTP diphosphatase